MYTGFWENRAEFEAWWREHGRNHNRLAVTDPREWERVAKKTEKALAGFNRAERPLHIRHPGDYK